MMDAIAFAMYVSRMMRAEMEGKRKATTGSKVRARAKWLMRRKRR